MVIPDSSRTCRSSSKVGVILMVVIAPDMRDSSSETASTNQRPEHFRAPAPRPMEPVQRSLERTRCGDEAPRGPCRARANVLHDAGDEGECFPGAPGAGQSHARSTNELPGRSSTCVSPRRQQASGYSPDGRRVSCTNRAGSTADEASPCTSGSRSLEIE
jgi:hypothetical protein